MHRPRHARPSARRPLACAAGIAVALAAVAVPLSGVQGASAAPAQPEKSLKPEVPATHVQTVSAARAALPGTASQVIVKPGDTLWKISGAVCGNPGDDLALAYNNGIANPDRILAGQLLKIACRAAASALAAKYPPPKPASLLASSPVDTSQPDTSPVTESAAAPVVQDDAAQVSATGSFSCSALEALWEEAGGNPADAFMAAEIATAESGGNPNAISPTDDYGLWQINASHGPAMATLNPGGNAEAAVSISDDGTDWGAWTTYTSGAYAGRC